MLSGLVGPGEPVSKGEMPSVLRMTGNSGDATGGTGETITGPECVANSGELRWDGARPLLSGLKGEDAGSRHPSRVAGGRRSPFAISQFPGEGTSALYLAWPLAGLSTEGFDVGVCTGVGGGALLCAVRRSRAILKGASSLRWLRASVFTNLYFARISAEDGGV